MQFNCYSISLNKCLRSGIILSGRKVLRLRNGCRDRQFRWWKFNFYATQDMFRSDESAVMIWIGQVFLIFRYTCIYLRRLLAEISNGVVVFPSKKWNIREKNIWPTLSSFNFIVLKFLNCKFDKSQGNGNWFVHSFIAETMCIFVIRAHKF